MARTPAVLALIVATAGTSAGAAVVVSEDPQVGLKSVADRMHSTVIGVRALAVVLMSPGSDGQEATRIPMFGTGVLIGDRLAITTLHSVGAAAAGKVTAWTDIEVLLQGKGQVQAGIAASFPDLDLALLRLSQTAPTASIALAPALPAEGEPLVAMGTDDESVTVIGVTVAAVRGDQLLLTSARRVDSRYWGGPLFDIRGRLAGVLLPSVMPKAISAPALAALLDRLRKP